MRISKRPVHINFSTGYQWWSLRLRPTNFSFRSGITHISKIGILCFAKKRAKMAKNRDLIFGKIMVQVRVFVDEKSIGTRFKTRRCNTIFAFLLDQKWHFLFTDDDLIQHATLSAIRISP